MILACLAHGQLQAVSTDGQKRAGLRKRRRHPRFVVVMYKEMEATVMGYTGTVIMGYRGII